MLAWLPGEVRCGGTVVAAMPMRRPLNSLAWKTNAELSPLTYGFDIDSTGRTIGIRRIESEGRTSGSEDIAPSLAATRFAPGAAYSNCTITYVPRQTGMNETPITDLMSYTMTPLSGALPQEGWARITSQGDCAGRPPPALRIRAFPNFRALQATAGVKDWSMVGYDIDASGRTRNVQLVSGTRNIALDEAAKEAVADTRFYDGPRTGCRYPYWRTPATLAAPPAPDQADFRPLGATCPKSREWVVRPTLRFPEPYRRRVIEGWAIITYDVAPWGEIGNIEVAASQPTEDFGTQAVAVVRNAKLATTQGLVGCVEYVKFKMNSYDQDERNPAAIANRYQ